METGKEIPKSTEISLLDLEALGPCGDMSIEGIDLGERKENTYILENFKFLGTAPIDAEKSWNLMMWRWAELEEACRAGELRLKVCFEHVRITLSILTHTSTESFYQTPSRPPRFQGLVQSRKISLQHVASYSIPKLSDVQERVLGMVGRHQPSMANTFVQFICDATKRG